jgi:hypothetical protein
MIDASPEGKHMSEKIFRQTLHFVSTLCDHDPLFISGGEPLDHPQFFNFIDIALKQNFFILIMSNGLFLKDDSLKNKIFTLIDNNKNNISFQITNDKRYYPTQIPEINHNKICYESQLRTLSPFGRAITNNLTIPKQTPHCFNLRSITHSFKWLPTVIQYLRSHSKFCTPSINIDGIISAGESNQCYNIGNVTQSFEMITNNILNMKCNKCGLESNLESIHKQAISI